LKQTKTSSRRSFLNKSAGAAAAIGLSELLSPLSFAGSQTNRAVVCIYLIGSNDSNNMIVPLDPASYQAYAASRGALGIAADALLPVRATSGQFGFHPALAGLQDLYNQNALAVLANVGRMMSGPVPAAAFQDTSMPVRFLQDGYFGIPWATAPDASQSNVVMLNHGVTVSSPVLDPARRTALTGSIRPVRPQARTGRDLFGRRLATVLSELRSGTVPQPAFMVPLEGFDTRTRQQERQTELFTTLNNGLVDFYRALREMGIAGNVTVYTDSESGRALVPNQLGGTDRGWGSHQLILGGATLGGEIYGRFPKMQVGGDEDAVGNGTWIPSTSSTQYAETLAAWYGKPNLAGLPEYPDANNALRPRLNFLTS
jgi:uncharacterized protein (DUF1501 family)